MMNHITNTNFNNFTIINKHSLENWWISSSYPNFWRQSTIPWSPLSAFVVSSLFMLISCFLSLFTFHQRKMQLFFPTRVVLILFCNFFKLLWNNKYELIKLFVLCLFYSSEVNIDYKAFKYWHSLKKDRWRRGWASDPKVRQDVIYY